MGGPAYWFDNAYWIPGGGGGGGGVLEKSLIRDYTGNNVASRIIDLGDDYQEVIIRMKTGGEFGIAVIQAWAILTVYGLFSASSSLFVGGNADFYWQGKMTGVDANKIKLGSAPAAEPSTNKSGILYQIVAKKFSLVTP